MDDVYFFVGIGVGNNFKTPLPDLIKMYLLFHNVDALNDFPASFLQRPSHLFYIYKKNTNPQLLTPNSVVNPNMVQVVIDVCFKTEQISFTVDGINVDISF